MGTENFIGYGAIIGAAPQDLGFDSRTQSSVEIGNSNTIREYCTIHRGSTEGTATTIGDGNFLMVGNHLGHNCILATAS
jgi:Acyl-[acyl carrier protein]--UDP-N-acetylglucosamine O-acyltransferase